jgi:hypothetical protein
MHILFFKFLGKTQNDKSTGVSKNSEAKVRGGGKASEQSLTR